MNCGAEGKERIKPEAARMEADANEVIGQKRSLQRVTAYQRVLLVFTIEQEEELLSYILKAGKSNFGVTVDEIKKLTFQYAKANNAKYPAK
ncbi:hypothetical protein ILUMI_23100 [Ignelater luminosus]|uniref:Uncharacterized protein n=1 Tax=Ignelater luminosus TaxID=2038154 RepID=A0A8K0C9E7_IGNLU|nr:hypothetical protein ILUMI_23100 [Ignelater luminosus]